MLRWLRRSRPGKEPAVDFLTRADIGCTTCGARLEMSGQQDHAAAVADFFAVHGEGHETWVDLSGDRRT